MAGSLLVTASLEIQDTEVEKHTGLTSPVAVLAEKRQGLPEDVGGLPVAPLPYLGKAKACQRGGFCGTVADGAGGAAGMGMNGDSLGVVATRVKVAEKDGRQADGMAGPSVSCLNRAELSRRRVG